MKEPKRLLELRKKIKRKKPNFSRQDSHKKKRLNKGWRKPKGLHSKMRLSKKGYKRSVTKGHKSPKMVRGFDKSGLKIIIINSIKELEKINPNEFGILISAKIGLKKKIMLVKKAKEKGITMLNIKNAEKWIKEKEDTIKKKKELKEKKTEKKEVKKKELEKKAEEKKEDKLTEKLTEEEKKQKEKEEKDKILTKKN